MSLRLRIRILTPVGRRLRVIIYARYSTEEQHPSSIDDQIAYCKEFLRANGITDAEIVVLSDAEMSGELVSRPGIDQVRERVCARWPDLLLCEDSSRLYRHETACGELIETAVDLNVRVIAINDHMDTADEDWDDRLHEAARHHARANKYTARRIKRKLEGLWRTGAAIGLLRPGYTRRPSVPATAEGPAQGPFFDEKDGKWVPVIYEAYERIANKEAPWLVARWLTEQGLPKCGNARSAVWTDRNVIDLIKRTIYRGWDTYRITVSRKERRSGKRRQVRNEPDEVLTRPMEHLRIVPDGLWYAANEAIKERALDEPAPRGAAHPLAGIPRNSRGPLSGLFVCHICGGKMYMEGRVEGGYRCSNAPRGLCWNKATALRDLTHERIGRAVVDRLLALDGVLDPFLAYVQGLLQDEEPVRMRQTELQAEEAEHLRARDGLVAAIEQAKEPPAVLLERLQYREAQLARTRAEREWLDAQQAAPAAVPTREQLTVAIQETAGRLLAMDREAGELLRRLVGPIRAVPHQQFGSNLVVLRARFELQLAALLPDRTLACLRGKCKGPAAEQLHRTTISVDLFKRSAGPKHFARALALSEAKYTLEEVGRELGVAKRQAHIAAQYGRAMRAAGLTDPYMELTEPPAAASRWRTHRADPSGQASHPPTG